jgi:hypothetical protein
LRNACLITTFAADDESDPSSSFFFLRRRRQHKSRSANKGGTMPKNAAVECIKGNNTKPNNQGRKDLPGSINLHSTQTYCSFCIHVLHLHIVFGPKAYPFFAADDDCVHAAWSVICQKCTLTKKQKGRTIGDS